MRVKKLQAPVLGVLFISILIMGCNKKQEPPKQETPAVQTEGKAGADTTAHKDTTQKDETEESKE